MSAAQRIATGLALSVIALGTTVIVPQAASASPGYLYSKWGANCNKGDTKRAYETSISRHHYDEQHIRMNWGYPEGKSVARQRAYNRARVEPYCVRGQGPGVWKWHSHYYGIASGKVSRLKIGYHMCSRAGTCSKAHKTTYGTWRAGWTHEKV
ncbi:hypothetical protein ACIBHY_28545 [Nonomuraea sp. NPDC050547]|uniref:hypothetical protein n=1 Tax=unclassified Nonomuraea TaxID=2593643 RepID=UPI0037ACB29D